jgi:2,3-bisphosphoglycerate-dependent phosphoglycerate mutase
MQLSTRVLVVRHGQTSWNAQLRLQGHTDIGLDETGQSQARLLALAVSDEGVDVVYTSDLQRALHTAQALAQATKAPLLVDAGLRERYFGRFEGKTFAEIDRLWPEDAKQWRRREPLAQPGGSESLSAFSERCVGAAHRLVAQHPGQHVALVAHGGVLDCLYRAATGAELTDHRTWALDNATVNRLLWTPQGFTVVGWNDTSHLATLASTG